MIAEIIIQLIGEAATFSALDGNKYNKGCLWFVLALVLLLVGVITYNTY